MSDLDTPPPDRLLSLRGGGTLEDAQARRQMLMYELRPQHKVCPSTAGSKRRCVRRKATPLSFKVGLDSEVCAVGRDGDHAALGRAQELYARLVPALDDFRVRVAVSRVAGDGDDGDAGARRGDEGGG